VRGLALVATLLVGLGIGAGLGTRVGIGRFHRPAAEVAKHEPAGAVTARVTLPKARYADGLRQTVFVEQLLARVSALPGVEAVAATRNLPIAGRADFDIMLSSTASVPDSDGPVMAAVTPGYFAAMRIPLTGGRDFDGRDTSSGAPVAIASAAAAERLWPGENPLGKRVQLGSSAGAPWIEIVGIAGDAPAGGGRAAAELYVPYAQSPSHVVMLVIRATGDPQRLAAALEREVAAVHAAQPVSGRDRARSRRVRA
jgi:putative ABC transport system permease protein